MAVVSGCHFEDCNENATCVNTSRPLLLLLEQAFSGDGQTCSGIIFLCNQVDFDYSQILFLSQGGSMGRVEGVDPTPLCEVENTANEAFKKALFYNPSFQNFLVYLAP